ncbi:hypothetical protein AIOL_002134 [Candidatus Rhodobacter oscarellae]|uniref:Uncharacterized protein n=1 Tax=Candidatus Rhodobacter oscarellae TaxID=1675527 RepID=A0A0J9GUC2_9RHOB|nr:hypothetical protein [Candidatus Rhodobacter lobularis]KMW57173.1 hypothetical protein AIOL_002134 [Candidatus Rhodobacter lobularis]
MQSSATLFYATPPEHVFDRLGDDLTEAFKETGITPRAEFTSSTDAAYSIDALRVAVSHVPMAVDLHPILRAHARSSHGQAPACLRRSLLEHRAAVFIQVSGSAEAAHEATRLAICYIATAGLIRRTLPELINWTKSGALYTPAEFFQQTGDEAPSVEQAPAPAPVANLDSPVVGHVA